MMIAIATCDKVSSLTESEQMLIPLFLEKGVKAVPEVWDNSKVNWSMYDAVIIRSVWDYHLKADLFLNWLKELTKLNIRILNNVDIVKRNHHKFYLEDLKMIDISIIPTYFIRAGNGMSSSEIEWDKIVIKPAVSASSYNTSLIKKENLNEFYDQKGLWLQSEDYLIQKFIPEIQSFGELSIIFFNRKYSHTVLKTAKANEFRVQNDFGGKSILYYPDKNIVKTAEKILSSQSGDLLYARIDGTIINDEFVLMEAELIEPELFFHLAPGSINFFVNETLSLLKN